MSYILFLAGFILLIKGAEWLVEGASALAHRLNVPNFLVGLTVVALGTSLPELVVSLLANFSGESAVGVGNILGSNIFNILLILGLAALIKPVEVLDRDSWKEIFFSVGAAVLLGILANDSLVGSGALGLSRVDGVLLLIFLYWFLRHVTRVAKERVRSGREYGRPLPWGHLLLLVLGGLGALVLGGNWVVNGAIEAARWFGVSGTVIGLTIVAMGTSLPELATVLVAIRKRHFDLAVGDIVGASILNIAWTLGLNAVLRPLVFESQHNADIAMVVGANLLFVLFLLIGRRNFLEKWQGGIFVLIYLVYLIWVFGWRG